MNKENWLERDFPGRIVTWAWSLAKGQYMVSWLLTGAPEQRYWQNRETANVGLDSSVGRAPARQSGGRRFKSRSSQFSLFIQIYLKICTQSVSLVVYYMTFIKKSRIPLWCIPYCLFPGRIVTWAWSLAKGQYMVSWLLTGAPEQRYWQNRETANVGLDSSVGRAPARQSGGRRFKSRSSQFSLFIQIYLK